MGRKDLLVSSATPLMHPGELICVIQMCQCVWKSGLDQMQVWERIEQNILKNLWITHFAYSRNNLFWQHWTGHVNCLPVCHHGKLGANSLCGEWHQTFIPQSPRVLLLLQHKVSSTYFFNDGEKGSWKWSTLKSISTSHWKTWSFCVARILYWG